MTLHQPIKLTFEARNCEGFEVEKCPMCISTKVSVDHEDTDFTYGCGDEAVTINYKAIVHTCLTCTFRYTGYLDEEAQEAAIREAMLRGRIAQLETNGA